MAEHIQIGDISPRIQYSGDGVQTVFTYPFPIFVDANIEVYEDTGLKTITADYTVTGAGNSSGGTVTFVSAPAVGVVVTLLRNLAIERTSDFQESGEFRAKVINDELDKIVAGVQQVETDHGRALRLSTTDSATTTVIPDKATRSGKVLVFDSNGDPSVSTEDIAAIEGAAISAAAAAVDAAAADADATTATTKAAEAAASAALALGATTGKYDAHINISNADSPYTLASLTADTLITVTTTGGAVIINLPAASGETDNRLLGINKNGAANTISINPNGADTIGGGASFVQYDDTEWVDLYLDKANVNWQVGNLSFTSAGDGLSKAGSTITLDKTNKNTWTGPQRSTATTDNDGSFDLDVANNFKWTPSAADVLEFTNENLAVDQGGTILLVNPSAYAITKGADVACGADFLVTVSAVGTYIIAYYCDGTTTYVGNSPALAV